MADIRLHESHIVQPRFGDPGPRLDHRARIALDPHDSSRGADEPGRQHSDVADAGADVQNALARAYARIAEQAFGEWIEDRGLPNQAFVFGVRVAEDI